MSKELLAFKNKPDKIIICYSNDERNGVIGARTMSDRGYENTILVNGGIEKFIENFSSMVEGNNIPQLVDQGPQ
jgi:rhodanese-related sulfurtransferase